MTELRTVRVAAVQATPVMLDADATVAKACGLLGEAAAEGAEHGIHCVIGVNERESERPGSLYNTMLLIGPDGLLHKHRKLMPTMQERVFHGFGNGDDLAVTPTPAGRIGGLICWEN